MIDDIVERQAALIAALDAGDADAIIAASDMLAAVVEAIRTRPTSVDPDQLGYALKQTNAASIRVNYLSHWTRQKIDRLAEHRGQRLSLTYANQQKRARIEV